MEYKEFAKYYDKFYQKKNYLAEVDFLFNFIKKDDKIIDIGCGTGVHGGLIAKKGFIVDGVDLNKEMLDIARKRLNGALYQQNILNFSINKKYDIIMSMFAVVNHLNDINDLKRCLNNFKNILSDNGIIIIDLHNPQSSGEKSDSYDGIKRTMKWDFDKESRLEKSEITFIIDDVIYKDSHIFRIFTIDEVRDACISVGLVVDKIFENYNINIEGNSNSKNLQFIIKKL